MYIIEYRDQFDKVIDFFKNDITGLRTGRANTAMVEDITVEAYGTRQALKAVASISIADAKTLNVEPWDKSLLGAVEKGIRDSSLGINPVNDGRLIRVILPELTSERRIELTKVLRQKEENARISVRKVREEVRDSILESEKNKEISEDDRFKLQDDLEEMVKSYNEKIKEISDKKEEEINQI